MSDRVVRGTRSRAVLVGVARYDDPALPDLPSGSRGAEDLVAEAAKWQSSGALDIETVVDPTRDEFVRALANACAEADDQLLLYFSGHGVVSTFGDLVLATRDYDSRASELTGLSWNTVRRTLADARARSIVVILDCCFVGATEAAWQENWRTAEPSPVGDRGPRVTYLMAGRAPWPYQPGILGAALRAAIEAQPADRAPDLAAMVRQLRRVEDVNRPKGGELTAAVSERHDDYPQKASVFLAAGDKEHRFASSLRQALASKLGSDSVFPPSRSTLPGTHLARVVSDEILRSKIIVVVIGPGWESRHRASDDWVVQEVSTALSNDLIVVPVLFGARGTLRPDDLPESIRALALLQFLHVPHRASDDVVGSLVDSLLILLHLRHD